MSSAPSHNLVFDKVSVDNAPMPVIFGLEGPDLTDEEREFFKKTNPFGFILFARNCKNPEQLKALAGDLQNLLERHVPILIDQEGGRVQRLKQPHWLQYSAARRFGDIFMRDFGKGKKALVEETQKIASDLSEAGLNVNCAPVLDIAFPDTHDAIGDRAFSSDPDSVGVLGALVCETYMQAGIIPVIKHFPGLGRADLDTHYDLPSVTESKETLLQSDLLPYKHILDKPFSPGVWGMIGHAIYTDLDNETPASCSRSIIFDLLREELGFNGVLLTDDINMQALEVIGDEAARVEKALKAGCDIALHCNGNLGEMMKIAKVIPPMREDTVKRINKSLSWTAHVVPHPDKAAQA